MNKVSTTRKTCGLHKPIRLSLRSLTITLVWSDEIEEYKAKKEQKKHQEFVNDTKNIIKKKQNAKMQERENDSDIKNIIKEFEDTIVDELHKEKYLAQLRKILAKKEEADLNDKNIQESIKFMEKRIKNIENGTDTMY